MSYNLDNFSFDEWVEFIFDHSIEKIDGKEWYWQDEWHSEFKNNTLQINYLTKLFQNPETLNTKFSWEQINQGFWFLMASGYMDVHIADYEVEDGQVKNYEQYKIKKEKEDEAVTEKGLTPDHGMFMLLNDGRIDFLLREKCIKAMENLYIKLFTDDPTKSASFMWWDEICFDYFMKKAVTVTEDGLKVQNAMFQTLGKILNSNSKYFQLCALHGLGHLRHKDTVYLINEYLERNPSLPAPAKDYAEGCFNGTMDRIHIPYECF